MKNIWEILDYLICKYTGIDKQEITLNHLKKIGNQILISNTEQYKRHQHTQKIEDFFDHTFNRLDDNRKKNLGLALGKILAKNLIVSFETIQITNKQRKN